MSVSPKRAKKITIQFNVTPNLPSAVDADGDLLLRSVQAMELVVPLKAEKE